MNDRMMKIKKVESETENKLKELDNEISSAKMIRAVSEKLKNFRVDNKEKVIADTVTKIFGKAADKIKKKTQEKENEEVKEEEGKKVPSFVEKLKSEISKLNQDIRKEIADTGNEDGEEKLLEKEGSDIHRDNLKVSIFTYSECK